MNLGAGTAPAFKDFVWMDLTSNVLGILAALLTTVANVPQVSACALAGTLASEVEWAPELTEQSGTQIGAGPTLLGMKDGKIAYDVTTPDKVWMFWNVMLYARRPSEVMAQMEPLAHRAADGLERDSFNLKRIQR